MRTLVVRRDSIALRDVKDLVRIAQTVRAAWVAVDVYTGDQWPELVCTLLMRLDKIIQNDRHEMTLLHLSAAADEEAPELPVEIQYRSADGMLVARVESRGRFIQVHTWSELTNIVEELACGTTN